jgi:hypothetical protein
MFGEEDRYLSLAVAASPRAAARRIRQAQEARAEAGRSARRGLPVAV